jgi:glycosyltransferase involved in cell wall biosynthesis
MRVLVVHNRYSSRVPSGENLAVDDEVRWLVEAGVEVHRHEVTNDEIVDPGPLARARDGLDSVLSWRAGRQFVTTLATVRPDVVHVHNLFPLLTATVPAVARHRGLPVVWTVHNFRTRCVAGTNFRDGRPCHACRPGWRVPGVTHRCYAGSAAASTLVGTSASIFRSWARRRGVVPVAISHEMARWVADAAGFPADRVRVKYNGVATPAHVGTDPPARERTAFVYAGRLSHEKGVGLLLDAWRRTTADVELRVVGSGDLAGAVERAASGDPRIVLVGQVPTERMPEHLRAARAVVIPSVWEEPFGRVAAEALANGRAVVTTGRGALDEIVDSSCGWVTGVDPGAVARALDEAAADDAGVDARGAAGRRRHAERFAPDPTTRALIEIYEDAIRAARQHDRRPG